MDYAASGRKPENVRTDLLAIALTSGLEGVPDSLTELDEVVGEALTRAIGRGIFTGERDKTLMLFPERGPGRVLLVGMGGPLEVVRDSVRRAAAIAARQALAARASRLAFLVPDGALGGVKRSVAVQAAIEGAGQGAWSFREFKAADQESIDLKRFVVLTEGASRKEIKEAVALGSAVARGQAFARRLQALPGNECTPTFLGSEAKRLGREHGFTVTVMDGARIRREKMGALWSVARGSRQDPRFIVMEYKGGKGPPICLVGKGITFDTGGISLKPPQKMEEMKYDMSGAAAVMGAMDAIGRIKPAVNVIGVVPSAENMPSGDASRPGDIVKSHLGKTIEVINTDAEGRLILCDALSWVRRYKPALVVDAATLTGAVVIALGHHSTAVMGNDDALIEEIRNAGDSAGERVWPLPMWDEYREQLQSDFADVKNSGGRPAGSITAGWFLREFVEDYPWAHLDIAGTAYSDSDTPHMSKGPTGVGVRLFVHLVLARAAD